MDDCLVGLPMAQPTVVDARPALAGYESNRKANKRLKEFLDDSFRHRPYTKLRLPNADEHEVNGAYDEPYVHPDLAHVSWDPNRYYAVVYNHVLTCRGSCGCSCNPTNRRNTLHIACLHEGDEESPLPQACGGVNVIEQERYIHDQECTGGCDNLCVERFEIRDAERAERVRMHQEMRAARASSEVPDPRTGRGGWGSSSHGDSVAVGGWGNPGEQRVSGGWGASSPNIWNTTASGDGWGETVSGQRNIDSWGRGASGNVGGWGSNTAQSTTRRRMGLEHSSGRQQRQRLGDIGLRRRQAARRAGQQCASRSSRGRQPYDGNRGCACWRAKQGRDVQKYVRRLGRFFRML